MTRETEGSLTILEWLGFRKKPDLSCARSLGKICGIISIILAGILAVSAIFVLVNFLMAALRVGPYGGDDDGSGIRNTGIALAGLMGAPFVVWRSIVAAKQVRIADESLFNDKINAAARDLSARHEITRVVKEEGKKVVLKEWKDDLVTRAAAIDRLEGLAQERNAAAPRIVRLLGMYIRGNFPCVSLVPTEPLSSRKIPAMDLQAAVSAVGRVLEIAVMADSSHWRLDLKGCDFDGVSFREGFFWAADFSECRFEGSLLNEGNFEGCLFRRSLLNYADFSKANMTGAKFDKSIINRPIPELGIMNFRISSAVIRGATFIGSDISALDYLGEPNKISETFGTRDTIVSDELREYMPDEDLQRRAKTVRDSIDQKIISEDKDGVIDLVDKTGFQNWSPYDSSDSATGYLLDNLYKRLDMNRWPYR